MKHMLFCLTLISTLAASAQAEPPKGVSADVAEAVKGIKGSGPDLLATFRTSQGDIRCRLFYQKVPKTVANFAGLATGNKEFLDPKAHKKVKRRFYDGLIIHRVIPNFMIQTGDPLGTGSGGPGFTIPDEFHKDLRHDRGGMLSMANRGPNTGGSQFFITEKATPWLDHKHAIFGECKDLKTIAHIARLPVVPPNRPREDVRIEKLTIAWGKF